ncbi:DUF447 domain-containing protein [Pyrolobus fumarii]|uniref:DUF447 domain-containing protein n=1 Tax=Pyrolobus fumarii TaxID=54252 RepID=UPI00143289E5|nr:DUF447 domain-containing protein [Pyrolobus fumarii]
MIYETIASIATLDHGCRFTPLGVVRDGDMLYAWLYPGTTLYNATLGGCVVLSVPSDPIDYARVLFGEARTENQEYCCPTLSNPYLVIEARVESIEMDGYKKRLTLRPVRAAKVSDPEPFTRLASCLVELLIAYTRVKVFDDCSEKLAHYRSVEPCISFLERRARGEYLTWFKRILASINAHLDACRGVG